MRYPVPFVIFLLAINSFKIAIAQSLRYHVALPYVGLSAYSGSQNDPFSFTANQAALAKNTQAGIGLYGEQRYLLAATNSYAVAGTLPTNMGSFGMQLNYSGFKNYNEHTIGLAYARSLGAKMDIGIQFNYFGYSIPAYGNASTINVEAGAIIHFTDKLNGGFHIYNPAGGKLNKADGEKLAAVYTMGLGYDASTNFYVGAGIIKEEDKPVNVETGFQYHFSKQFFVRGGFMSVSSTAFAGTGVGWNNLRLDVSGSYHPQLGFSPGVLLIAYFGNRKE
ncbi:hypothetical protein [Ferruginibacter sp. SUN106]|uniref:hypothetical protein n=1 Tax=Ferruginibacter sp. SUN106 TaxID=2978348 RepID=UPI003D35FE08